MSVSVTLQPCPHCGSSVMPGTRWCTLCKGNIQHPEVGKLASPGLRLGAFVIDLIVPFIVLFMVGVSTLLGLLGIGSRSAAGGGFMTLLVFAGFIAYLVWVFKLFINGQTPGKLALKIRVVREDGTAPGLGYMAARELVGKWLSGLGSDGSLFSSIRRTRAGMTSW